MRGGPKDGERRTYPDFLTDESISDELKLALLSQNFDRERFARTKDFEHRKWRHSTPIAVALAGAVTIALNFLFDTLRTDQQSAISNRQAAQEFQYNLLRRELEKDQTPEERARILLFLARAGLLDDMNVEYLIAVAEKAPNSIPQFGRIDRAAEEGLLARLYTSDDLIDNIIEIEGGYVDHPSPTYAMKYGIRADFLERWRGEEVTKEDVRNLTKAEARAFYEDLLVESGADQLENVFLRNVYAQTAVNDGASRAFRFLQWVVGEPETGERNPKTFAKANRMAREKERETVIRFNCRRLRFYDGVQNAPQEYRDYWQWRIERLTPGSDLSGCENLLEMGTKTPAEPSLPQEK